MSMIPRPDHVRARDFDRWLKKIELSDDPDSCIRWLGGYYPSGYGEFSLDGRGRRAHIITYRWFIGPVPDGMLVCHGCPGGGNRWCVNPRHLYVDTPRGNTAFAVANGRMATGDRNGSRTHPERLPHGDAHWSQKTPEKRLHGERNSAARLTVDDVRQIRGRYIQGGCDQYSLARDFKVSQATIWRIVHRKTWTHID